jgi:iron complex outermembrane receptor protein
LVIARSAAAQQLEPPGSLDTVIVSAERLQQQLETERALTPGAVTLVDGAQLYERNVTTLADLLRYVPGIWAESSSGAEQVFFSSRGSNLDATDYDKNGIKLLQDGLPVTTADGNNHNRILDPLSARYATVAHGANALTYGASTLGGAIDFLSPNARNSAPVALFLSGGSHGQLNARATAGTVNGAFDGLLTLESKSWDGYREHTSQEGLAAYLNTGWRWSDSLTTRVYGTWLDNDEELPGTLTRAEFAEDPGRASNAALNADYRKRVQTRRIATKTSWSIDDNSSLDVGLSYEKQMLYHPIVDRILVDFDGPGPLEPVEVFSLLVNTDHRDTGATVRYNLRAGDHDVLAGINYGDGTVSGANYRNLAGRRNGISEFVDNAAESVEAFLVDRWHLDDKWTLIYGAQYVAAGRDIRTTNAGSGAVGNPAHNYSAINPRLGVTYAIGQESEMFASASRLFEAPTTFEMQDDARGGDATLDAMKGVVYEVGTRGNSGTKVRWNWDVSFYYAQIRDEILSVEDPAAPGTSLSTNIDKTVHAGVEALFGASFAPGNTHRIEPTLSLTLNDFSFDGDDTYGGNDLPAAPRYVMRGEVMYRHTSGFHAGPTFDLIGGRFADFANTYRVGSYALLGLRGGYSGKAWEVFAELRNLLDEEYVSTFSVRDRGSEDAAILYPGAPRSVYVGIRKAF